MCSRAVNMEAFKTMILPAWSMGRDVVIESLGENKFAFYFSHDVDKRRILLEGFVAF